MNVKDAVWENIIFSKTGPFFPFRSLIDICKLRGVYMKLVDCMWYATNTEGISIDSLLRAQKIADLFNCILEPVSPGIIVGMPSSSYRPHATGAGLSEGKGGAVGFYWRIADRPRWTAFPGLRDYLVKRHKSSSHEGVDIIEFLDRGSSSDGVEIRIITDPLHPLKRVTTGSLLGAFARRDIVGGEVLGIYPGLLSSLSEMDPFLAALPKEEKNVAWSYDIETGIPSFSYHGAVVRNAMCAINDFHGIEVPHSAGASVKKVPIKILGVLPLVIFQARRAIPFGAELTLSYGPAWVKTFTAYFPKAKEFFITQSSEPLNTSRTARSGAAVYDQTHYAHLFIPFTIAPLAVTDATIVLKRSHKKRKIIEEVLHPPPRFNCTRSVNPPLFQTAARNIKRKFTDGWRKSRGRELKGLIA